MEIYRPVSLTECLHLNMIFLPNWGKLGTFHKFVPPWLRRCLLLTFVSPFQSFGVVTHILEAGLLCIRLNPHR